MVFWGCSDVVESRVEQAILDAESRRNAAFTSDSEQPRRASPQGDARTSDKDSPRRAGPPYKGVGRLVKRSSEFVEDPRCGNTKFVAL